MASDYPMVCVGDIAQSVSEAHKRGKDLLIFLNTSDILHGKLLHRTYSSVKGWPGQAKKSIRRHDILFSEIRPANGRWAYIDEDAADFVVSTKLMVIRADTKRLLPRYLYYFLTSSSTSALLQHLAESRSGTFPQITFDQVASLELLLPPLPEQRAIAHILGTLDDKIELNRRMARTLEEMARALFKSWFVDFEPVRTKMDGRWRPGESLPGLPAHLYGLFPDRLVDSELGPIPEGWEVGCVGKLAKVSSGKRPDARFSERSEEASVPLWGGNGIMAFVRKPLFNEPILLTGRVGTLGSVFRITDPCWPSDNTLILRANEPSVFQYLFLQLHQVSLALLNRGSAQPLLTQTDLKTQRLVVPTKSILETFSRVTNSMYCRFDESTAEIRTLAALRDALLPKLISGELRVPDAERIAGRLL